MGDTIFFYLKKMIIKILTIIVDTSSNRDGFIRAIEHGGPDGVTSALGRGWGAWTIVITEKGDKWKQVWKTCFLANDPKIRGFQDEGNTVHHTLCFAPSHGVNDGVNLQWLPKAFTKMKTAPVTVEEWLESSVHAFELPVSIALAMAFQNGFMAVHFHCCNVALELDTLAFYGDDNFPDILRVTAFKGVIWGTPHANIADKWLVRGLPQRGKEEDGKLQIPLGDGWLFRLAFSGLHLGKTQKSRLLGPKRTRKEKEIPIVTRKEKELPIVVRVSKRRR